MRIHWHLRKLCKHIGGPMQAPPGGKPPSKHVSRAGPAEPCHMGRRRRNPTKQRGTLPRGAPPCSPWPCGWVHGRRVPVSQYLTLCKSLCQRSHPADPTRRTSEIPLCNHTDGQTDGRTNGTDGQTYRRTDGRTDRQADGQTDGRAGTQQCNRACPHQLQPPPSDHCAIPPSIRPLAPT